MTLKPLPNNVSWRIGWRLRWIHKSDMKKHRSSLNGTTLTSCGMQPLLNTAHKVDPQTFCTHSELVSGGNWLSVQESFVRQTLAVSSLSDGPPSPGTLSQFCKHTKIKSETVCLLGLVGRTRKNKTPSTRAI